MKHLHILILVIILLMAWLWQAVYLPIDSNAENETIFVIEKGEGLKEISECLKDLGLIKSKLAFQVFVLAKGMQKNLQAGKYALSGELSAKDMANKFANGDIIRETITVIEGWSIKDIAWHFENRGMFQAEEILEAAQGLEGYLFPDTYELDKEIGEGESRAQIIEKLINKMLANFDSKITQEIKDEIASQGRTLREIVIMASMLEKEVKIEEEAKIAAGILWKRLDMGWPLQIDATIGYLTGKKSSELTKEDLAIDSPYNTYKYYGLPVGPICNPGLKFINAAVYYEDSPYWFYLTTLEGETIFSKTLEEHNINKAEYLQ